MEYRYFIEEDVTEESRYLFLHTEDHLVLGDQLISSSGEIIEVLGIDELSGVYVSRGVEGTESVALRRGEALVHAGTVL